MLYLATHPDRLCSIGEIAKAYDISQNHLMKVVSDLAAHGYVEALRGRNGGLRLARPAPDINIGRLIRHTEGEIDLVGCSNANSMEPAACPIHWIRRWPPSLRSLNATPLPM
jgi:Rrf2 family nitric oxide-sensitive transcriptional repressor